MVDGPTPVEITYNANNHSVKCILFYVVASSLKCSVTVALALVRSDQNGNRQLWEGGRSALTVIELI